MAGGDARASGQHGVVDLKLMLVGVWGVTVGTRVGVEAGVVGVGVEEVAYHREGSGTIGREMERQWRKMVNMRTATSSQPMFLTYIQSLSGKYLYRVWGTLKASPAGVVKKSICNLTGEPQSISLQKVQETTQQQNSVVAYTHRE